MKSKQDDGKWEQVSHIVQQIDIHSAQSIKGLDEQIFIEPLKAKNSHSISKGEVNQTKSENKVACPVK